MSLDDFAGARVYDARTVCVLRLRRQVAYHRETGIVDRHRRVVLGPLLANDGILEAGSLKGFVPVVDAGNEVFHPFLRRCRVNIVDNLLLRLCQLAGLVGFRVFRFQTVAHDDRLMIGGLLLVAELGDLVVEIADAFIKVARLHRFLWQQHH